MKEEEPPPPAPTAANGGGSVPAGGLADKGVPVEGVYVEVVDVDATEFG